MCSVTLIPSAGLTASAIALVDATVISPAQVSFDIATELLFSASTGVLTVSIPGGTGAVSSSGGTVDGASLAGGSNSPTRTSGSISSITESSSEGVKDVVAAVTELKTASASGTLATGQGISVSLTPSGQGDGNVYAIVAYN